MARAWPDDSACATRFAKGACRRRRQEHASRAPPPAFGSQATRRHRHQRWPPFRARFRGAGWPPSRAPSATASPRRPAFVPGPSSPSSTPASRRCVQGVRGSHAKLLTAVSAPAAAVRPVNALGAARALLRFRPARRSQGLDSPGPESTAAALLAGAVQAPSFTIAARHPVQGDAATPGPATYGSKLDHAHFRFPCAAGVAIAARYEWLREAGTPGLESPGPAAYTLPSISKSALPRALSGVEGGADSTSVRPLPPPAPVLARRRSSRCVQARVVLVHPGQPSAVSVRGAR